MGRTYSFEPFRAQQPAQTYKGSGPRLGNDEDKLAFTGEVAEEKAALAPPSPHYGQAHAETVKRYRSKAQTRARAPAKAATAKAGAAKKVKAPGRSAETQRAAAPKRVVTRAPARKAEPETEAKAPARKKVATAPTRGVGTLGRKVVARAAAAAKSVARAVKTAKKAAPRKPTKKR